MNPCLLQGLEVVDEIVKFGSITSENFQGLQGIGAVVQHSKGVSLICSNH